MAADPYSLENLHDIVEPLSISWWPPAAGTWTVLALLLVWITVIGLLLWIRYKNNGYRREALALLKQIRPGLQPAESRGSSLCEVAMLLKRTALSAYPRKDVAELTGEEWLAFLDHTGKTHQFSQGTAAVIGSILWQPQAAAKLSDQELEQVVNTVQRWISHHQCDGER